MKFPFCIAPLLLLQFINLTWALPWDLLTCPLPVPPPPFVQYVLSPDVGIDGNSTKKKIGPAMTKIINLLLPRQTVICHLVNCDAKTWCCNAQTCGFSVTGAWVCNSPTITQTSTSTYQSTTTSTITSTSSITSTFWNMMTAWSYISSTDTRTATVTVTYTLTQTSLTTSSITLTRRDMPTPTPTRCVRRTEEKKKRKRGLAQGADPTKTNTVTATVVVTATPATIYQTTTSPYIYWITKETTTTLTTFRTVDGTTTITSTYQTVTTTTSTVTDATTTTKNPSPDSSGGGGGGGGPSIGVKVGAGVGAGVGGLVVITLLAMLAWRKCTKPTAEEEWAGNQPVEDRNAPPGGAGPGMALVGAGGMVLAAGANDKVPYKAGYYDQGENGAMTETSSSPPPPLPPASPPAAYFQPVPYPQGYPGLPSPFLPLPYEICREVE